VSAGLPQLARAADAAPAAAPVNTVETVVVTAERRRTDVQRTPLAITAVTGKQIDQSFVTTVAGLNASVPSLEVTKASGFENLVTIRGVGSETPENSLTTVPGVSLFIDGVYIANTISLDQTLFDIDTIEVLRGPQGSLYGQSSIGGAIIINTQQPKLGKYDGKIDFSAGDYSLFRERGEVNVPLGSTLALRASVQKYDHSGFTKDLALPGVTLDAAHDFSGKASLLWKPTDDFSATLTAQYYRSDQAGDAQKNITDPAPDPREVYQDFPGHFKLQTQLYHANLEWDLPWFTLKSVTAEQILQHTQQEDGSRSTYALLGQYDIVAAWNTTVHNFTEEFDILSPAGSALEWTAGAFYLTQTSHQYVAEFGNTGTAPDFPLILASAPIAEAFPHPSSAGALLSYGNDSHATRDSYSAFVQATYHVTPNLRVTAGGRINTDHYTDPSLNFNGFAPTVNNFVDHGQWQTVATWRAEVDYNVTPDNMVYASAARGYKPGGVNGSYGQVVIPPIFQPETNTAFEVGAKNYFLDRSLRVNAAAFYYLHKNFQYIEDDPVPFDAGISNIPRVHDYGVEFEASYTAMDNRLHVNASLALEKGEVVGNYKTIDSTVANYLEGPSFTGGNSDGFDAAHAYGACAFFAAYSSPACWAAVEATAINIKGKEPPAMPKVSGSISASYLFETAAGAFTPRVEVIYRGSEWARIFNDPALDKVGAYTVTNLDFEFVPNGTPLRLSIAATNVFNVNGVNSRYTDPFGIGQTSVQYIPPRQVIGTIAYSF
jgi:iron complex outermembrane receptor protein